MNERYYVVERRFRCGRVSCRDCGCLVVDRLSHDIFHRRLDRLENGLPVDEGPLDTSFPASPKHIGDFWQTERVERVTYPLRDLKPSGWLLRLAGDS